MLTNLPSQTIVNRVDEWTARMLDGDRQFLDLVTTAYHRLAAIGDNLHAARGLTSGKRGLLISLQRHGPLTASRLAEMRPVSRQFVARIVDELKEDGFVEPRPNPRHKRSPLIALTAVGFTAVRCMAADEKPHLARLFDGISASDLKVAHDTLDRISERLADALKAEGAEAPRQATVRAN